MNGGSQWQDEMELLHAILAQTPLVETVKWGGPTFTHKGKNILGIGGFRHYVGIWFFQGALLPDPAGVLVNAQKGVTKALRQWRFTSVNEIAAHEKIILNYVADAIANEQAGLKIVPEKKPKPTSILLDHALQEDPSLRMEFDNFTPFKQREFIEHIESAKREQTRRSRLEKVLVMIRAGIGLHDKYR